MFKQIRAFFLILSGLIALGSHFAEAADLIVPDQYATIASALTAASNNTDTTDTIVLRRGTYSEHITLIDNVSLRGDETARTIIDGGGTGTVITAAKGSTIQRLTIRNGDTGIAVPGTATGVTVKNNIFIDQNSSGIQCTNTSSVTISNNTLDGNGTSITCTNSSSITIKNNIVSNNTTNDISLDQTTLLNSPASNRDFNLFFNNAREDYVDAEVRDKGTNNIVDQDPLFVDRNNNDFHLRAGSPAIGAADDNGEIGVYGGGNNDPPFPVSNLRVTPGTDTITVEWDQNLAHNVQGYKVYYDSDESNPPYQPPIAAGNVTTYVITGLSTSVTEEIPQNLHVGIGDTELLLIWTPVNRASVVGYRIYYGTTSGSYGSPIDVDAQAVPPYKLTDLTNNTTYYIAISTIAKPVYFVTVTTIDTESHESDFAPVKKTALTVSEVESQKSSEANEYPEETGRFPNISNKGGCFIATAAYGSPLEHHVQTLRAFRDRYLLTYSLGRKFVAFYYQTSPPLARWLEEHASFKPVVRAVLSPIVFVIALWMDTGTLGQLLIMVLFFSLVGFSVYRWGSLRWGGHY